MNAHILEFLSTEEIQYVGTQPRTTHSSIFPRIFRRILDILGCDQLDVYRELQAAFVPPVTNFLFSYDDGLLNPAFRAQVAESLTGLKATLEIIAIDSPGIDGMWALVPRCKRFTINGSRDHVCADDHGVWNHKAHPTIFVNTMLDSLLARTDISEAERLHLLVKGFAVVIHELEHLLHRYIHHPATKTSETLHASVFSSQPVGRGEGGECGEEAALGGTFSIDITPCTPHGYRLVGNTRKSKMLVVGVDERICKVVTLLTSPHANQPPGPPLPPFPCFAHPHHVIPLNGRKYKECFSDAPEGQVHRGLDTLRSNSLVQTRPSNIVAQIVPTIPEHWRPNSIVRVQPEATTQKHPQRRQTITSLTGCPKSYSPGP